MSIRRWLLSMVFVSSAYAFAQQPPYLDPKLSAADRARDLVGRMTLDEKAAQLEDWATSIPRLGIPDYQTWNEALHGVARAGYATVFPQAIGMAATWDTSMVHRMGEVINCDHRNHCRGAHHFQHIWHQFHTLAFSIVVLIVTCIVSRVGGKPKVAAPSSAVLTALRNIANNSRPMPT